MQRACWVRARGSALILYLLYIIYMYPYHAYQYLNVFVQLQFRCTPSYTRLVVRAGGLTN